MISPSQQLMITVHDYNNKSWDKDSVKIDDLQLLISENMDLIRECMKDPGNLKELLEFATRIKTTFHDDKGERVAEKIVSIANDKIHSEKTKDKQKPVLPHELIEETFSYLDLEGLKIVSQVSQKWNESVEAFKPQKLISLRSDMLSLDEAIEYIIKHKLLNVDLSEFRLSNTDLFDFPNLQGIILNECDISDFGCEALANNCPNLQFVSLNGTYINDKGLIYLAKNCHNLQSVSFANCRGITDSGLIDLSKECFNLQDVNFDSCPQITSKGLMHLIANCPKLKTINASQMNDEVLKLLADNCPNLQRVVCFPVDSEGIITNNGLVHLDKCRFLQTIRISNCAGINERGLEYLLNKCFNLQEISLNDCIRLGSGPMHLESTCPNLLRLELNNCRTSDDFWKFTINCPNLEAVISGGEGMKHLANNCPKLHSTFFSYTKDISNRFTREQQAPVLEEELMSLAKKCPNLQDVTFYYAAIKIDDLIKFVRSCPNLQRIDVSGCRFTNENLRSILNTAPHLRITERTYEYYYEETTLDPSSDTLSTVFISRSKLDMNAFSWCDDGDFKYRSYDVDEMRISNKLDDFWTSDTNSIST